MKITIVLDKDLLNWLEQKAKLQGTDIQQIINTILKEHMNRVKNIMEF